VIRARAAGDAAILMEAADPASAGPGGADTSTAARLAAAIRAAGLPGVIEVIPGARTVLVTVEPGSWDAPELGARLAGVSPLADVASTMAPAVDVDVCYDGPDLAEVAELSGLTVGEVIERHQAAEYRVGWLGFTPGFGYLTGLDEALGRVPRLGTPRLTVPAGSVAIAGGLAAVYPAASPGGWRLLGRTDLRLWDPLRDPPAIFEPGRRVRFRAVEDLPAPAEQAQASGGASRRATAGAARIIEVQQPGPLTTVQDLGRPGLGHLGVPVSGAADAASLRRANALVGNEAGAAALEVTMGRLAVRFGDEATVAVAGAPVPLRLTTPDGTTRQPLPGTGFNVGPGDVLRLGSPAAGLRSYIAADGGFDVAAVLGSRSSDRLSGLGPPPLRAGDVLPLGGAAAAAGRPEVTAGTGAGLPAGPAGPIELAAIAGPRDDWFTPAALAALASATFEVTAASNRTGLRLAGPRLERRVVAELPSEGMATGSVQVSHDGQPILLLADHPTTGGYPVIAVVRTADIDRAAQLRPGQRISFRLADPASWPARPGR
jgi:KipI family sensor histidine kinase inhibitor